MPERTELIVGEAAGQLAPAALVEWSQAQAQAQTRRGHRLWLSGALTHELAAPADLQRAGSAAWQAYARRLAGHYGLAAEGALASWRSGPHAGASLSDDGLGEALLALATRGLRLRLRLRAIHPLWLGGLALALRHARLGADASLLVVEAGLATRISLQQGRLAGVERHWLAEPSEAEAQRLARGALVVGERLPGTPAAAPLRFEGAAAWAAALAALPGLAAPDFAPAAPWAGARLGWALAATGALVLGVAALDAAASHRELQQAERRLAAFTATSVTTAAPTAPTKASGRSSAELDAETREQRMRSQLQHPWAAVFDSVDSLGPRGGRWLKLEQRAGDPLMRLEGSAANLDAVLDATRRLAERPSLADVQLLRSEQRPDGGLHFELRLRLNALGPGLGLAP